MHDPTVLQPPRASAAASTLFLVLCALVALWGIAASWGVLSLVDEFAAGAEVTEQQWRTTWGAAGLQILSSLGLTLLTGVCFIAWVHGAVRFARSLAPSANTTSPIWAALSAAVPVAQLVVPAKSLHAAYASCRGLEQQQRTGRAGPPQAPVVVLWNAAFALTFLANIAARFIGTADPFVEGATIESVQTFWYTYIALQAMTTVAAFLAIAMVMKLTSLQSRITGMDIQDEPEALPPAIMRAALPSASADGQVEQEPPLVPAQSAPPAPLSGGLPGMPPPAVTPEEEVVRRAALPKPEEDEPPRHYMPGMPPPPSQSEAA